MKVAYIAHPGRPCYELAWLGALKAEEVRILDADFRRYPPPEGPLKYCKVSAWDLRFFGSTARLVWYRDFERDLEQVDIVLVLELFSSLSNQLVTHCSARGIPTAVLIYELLASHPIYGLLPFRHFTRVTLTRAAGFVCITSAARRHLVALGVKASSSTVISPGIDTVRFSPLRHPRASKGVLFVGRLERHKGIDVVLETFDRVIKHHSARHMTIVGDGSGREAVVRAANANRNLEFHSHVPHREMSKLYADHDVFILPARDSYRFGRMVGAEQFGFALVEAMACGLAVVASDSGAIPEVVGDRNWICPQLALHEFPSYVNRALAEDHLEQIAGLNHQRVHSYYELRTQANRLYKYLHEVADAATR
jgi:glycosyltransferase involved in cell wall biosynthesis